MIKAHVYTVKFVRYDDDEYEQGTDTQLAEQLFAEIQEACDCGHIAGSFNLMDIERVDPDDPRASLSTVRWGSTENLHGK